MTPAEGRQRNRRVELVVNGDAIGNTAVASAAPSQAVALRAIFCLL